MRRNASIAAHLVQELPNANVLMLVGCPSGLFFDLPPRVDFVKLPSVLKVATNEWRSRKLTIGRDMTVLLRAKLIQQVAEVFRPDIFFVDHVPTGVCGELLPTLERIRKLIQRPKSRRRLATGVPCRATLLPTLAQCGSAPLIIQKRKSTKIVLGLRDILDSAKVIRAQWREQGIHRVIADHYDRVLVYGARDIFDTAAAYGLHEAAAKVRHCGYLCRPLADLAAGSGAGAAVRRLWPERRDFVVITAGGGHDAYPMMSASLEALRQFDADSRPEVLLITGPLMAADGRARLRQQAADLPVHVEDCVADAASPMVAADLVVTMGGYNTLMEAIRFGKQTLVVPRVGPSAEQQIRAALLDQMGLVRAVMPDEATPRRLAEQMALALREPRQPTVQLKFDGLSNVLANVKSMVGGDALETLPVPHPGQTAAGTMR